MKPAAVAIPKNDASWEQGKYGPVWPKTPACYGFTIIAKVKPGRAEAIRSYGSKLAKALESDPYVLAPLKLHYLRWVLFDDDTRFMDQGIFDTDFDKYTADAVSLFAKTGIDTVFTLTRRRLSDGKQTFSIPRRPIPRRLHGLPRFVVTRGGEYGFMPGLPALRWLGELT
jgi:hypothetical protein